MQNEWRVIAQKHACCPNSVSMRKTHSSQSRGCSHFYHATPGKFELQDRNTSDSSLPLPMAPFLSESIMRKVAKSAPHVFSFPKKCGIDALHGTKRSKRILIAGYLASFPRNAYISNEKARFSIRIEENLPRKGSFAHYLLQEHTFRA